MAAIMSFEGRVKRALSLRDDVSLVTSTPRSGVSVGPPSVLLEKGRAAVSDKLHPIQKPRRFYKAVEVIAEPSGGHAVRLDGRGPKSPAGKPLVLPTLALARLVADEWNAQATLIDSSAMPATRLAWTAIDRIGETREAVAAEVAAFAGTDLTCYLASHPTPLVERQAKGWGPVRDWARDDLGLDLRPVAGIIHTPQPPETLAAVERQALAVDDFTLAGLAYAAGLFGSAVLALAVRHGRLSGQDALDLSRLDEIFQAGIWGEDAEAAIRAAGMAVEATMLERWFASLRG
jgi:chaperone required for assembly of F1-ATPase